MAIRIPKINLAGLFGALKHVKDLPRILGYLKAAQEYIKLLDAISESLKQPAANLFYQVVRSIRSLKENAAKTDLNNDGDFLNDIDDKAYVEMENAAIAIMKFFHLDDDFQKLVELDKMVEPK